MSDRKMELRHDRHTVSLLSDHMVFAPKYRGKILTGDVAMITEGIICKTCKEMDGKLSVSILKHKIHIMLKTLATGIELKSGVCDCGRWGVFSCIHVHAQTGHRNENRVLSSLCRLF